MLDFGRPASDKSMTWAHATQDLGELRSLLFANTNGNGNADDMSILVIGKVRDVADAFGTSGFCRTFTFHDGTNEVARLRIAPAAGTFDGRVQNAATSPVSKAVTIDIGANLDPLRNQKFSWCYRVGRDLADAVAARQPSAVLYYGTTPTKVLPASLPTAFAAGNGYRQISHVVLGAYSTDTSHADYVEIYVLNKALSEAEMLAIHESDDPGMVIATHSANIVWHWPSVFKGSVNKPGDTVTTSNTLACTSRGGVLTTPVTCTLGAGTLTLADPADAGFTVDPSLVDEGAFDLSSTSAPAVYSPLWAQVANDTFTAAIVAAFVGNSRGIASDNFGKLLLDLNSDYSASGFVTSYSRNFAEGFASQCGLSVGVIRQAHFSNSGTGTSLMCWPGRIPKLGSVAGESGTTGLAVDYTRCGWAHQLDDNVGPGQHIYIPAGGGADFLAANAGEIGPTDRIEVSAWVLEFPNACEAGSQKVSYADGASSPFHPSNPTTPYNNDAALHGTKATTTGVNTSRSGGSYTISSITTTAVTLSGAYPGAEVGDAITVDGGSGTSGIGMIEAVAGANLTLEHEIGETTHPTASQAVYIGPLRMRKISVQFDGTETPNAWRGIRVTAEGSGFGLRVFWVGVRKLNSDGSYANGMVHVPIGDSGDGYLWVLNNTFATVGSDGKQYLTRMFEALGIDIVMLLGAQQDSSTPDHMDTVKALFTAAGLRSRDVCYAGEMCHTNSEACDTIQAYQNWADKVITDGAPGVQAFRMCGHPATQFKFGWRRDSSHPDESGMSYLASVLKTALAVATSGSAPSTPNLSGRVVSILRHPSMKGIL